MLSLEILLVVYLPQSLFSQYLGLRVMCALIGISPVILIQQFLFVSEEKSKTAGCKHEPLDLVLDGCLQHILCTVYRWDDHFVFVLGDVRRNGRCHMEHIVTALCDLVPTLLVVEIPFHELKVLFGLGKASEVLIFFGVDERTDSTPYIVSLLNQVLDDVSSDVPGGTCYQDRL